jgi:hypothetical protein
MSLSLLLQNLIIAFIVVIALRYLLKITLFPGKTGACNCGKGGCSKLSAEKIMAEVEKP